MSGPAPDRQALRPEVLRLHALGYSLHPIARKGIRYRNHNGAERETTGKGPLITNWQERRLLKEELLPQLGSPDVTGLGFDAGDDGAADD